MIGPSGAVHAIEGHSATVLGREYIARNTLIVILEFADRVVPLESGCGVEVIEDVAIVKAVKRDSQGLLRIENAAHVTFGAVTEFGDGVPVLPGVGGVKVVDDVGLVCSKELHSQTTLWAGGRGRWWWWRGRRSGWAEHPRWEARRGAGERPGNTWE